MKKQFKYLLLSTTLLVLSASLCQADDAENNSQLLCAVTEVIECDVLGECVERTAAAAALPDFLLIDIEAKKIVEATGDGVRETRFSTSTTTGGMTILTGIDGLRGWSAVLSDNNRRLTASISDELAGFVVFGACRAER